MPQLLCTIGFAGKSAKEFFVLLQDAAVQQVIDIRQHRGGQLSGFAKHPDLAYFLEEVAGIRYAHEPLLAPTPDLLKTYRTCKDWAAYERDFLSLMNNRGVPEEFDVAEWSPRIALLCSEPGPEKCHRRLVAELFQSHWRATGHEVEVRHLISPRAKAIRKKRKHAVIS